MRLKAHQTQAGGRRFRRLLACALFPLLACPSLAAEESADPPPLLAMVAAGREALRLELERSRTRAELERIGAEVVVTREAGERLEREIAALGQDREAVRQAMIDTASAQRRTGEEIAAIEEELTGLSIRETDIRASLHERRGTLAEVLAALQRMGRAPPPALLVRPDDALGSVRSAILLGAVVPSMREETRALAADLTELAELTALSQERRERFAERLALQREEEARLARLSQEKERLEAERAEALAEARERTNELAGRASSLEDLIATLEADLQEARRQEEVGRRLSEAEAERMAEEAEIAAREAERPAYDVESLRREMASLDVSAPFSTLKGGLSTPVAGELRRGFGEDDGFGNRTTGATFRARAGDLVTAPADGRILYSGPFRSYGQLLILNAGDGYHIVLAGMREIDVEAGEFVLAGEPVGVMGARRLASAGGTTDMSSTEPALYVEFRKDGKPVDPAPWWADGPSGRTRNDS